MLAEIPHCLTNLGLPSLQSWMGNPDLINSHTQWTHTNTLNSSSPQALSPSHLQPSKQGVPGPSPAEPCCKDFIRNPERVRERRLRGKWRATNGLSALKLSDLTLLSSLRIWEANLRPLPPDPQLWLNTGLKSPQYPHCGQSSKTRKPSPPNAVLSKMNKSEIYRLHCLTQC